MTDAMAAAQTERPVVFVVDDDPSIRDTLQDLLEFGRNGRTVIRINAGIPAQQPAGYARLPGP